MRWFQGNVHLLMGPLAQTPPLEGCQRGPCAHLEAIAVAPLLVKVEW